MAEKGNNNLASSTEIPPSHLTQGDIPSSYQSQSVVSLNPQNENNKSIFEITNENDNLPKENSGIFGTTLFSAVSTGLVPNLGGLGNLVGNVVDIAKDITKGYLFDNHPEQNNLENQYLFDPPKKDEPLMSQSSEKLEDMSFSELGKLLDKAQDIKSLIEVNKIASQIHKMAQKKIKEVLGIETKATISFQVTKNKSSINRDENGQAIDAFNCYLRASWEEDGKTQNLPIESWQERILKSAEKSKERGR